MNSGKSKDNYLIIAIGAVPFIWLIDYWLDSCVSNLAGETICGVKAWEEINIFPILLVLLCIGYVFRLRKSGK